LGEREGLVSGKDLGGQGGLDAQVGLGEREGLVWGKDLGGQGGLGAQVGSGAPRSLRISRMWHAHKRTPCYNSRIH
jgi:hypothetical protein